MPARRYLVPTLSLAVQLFFCIAADAGWQYAEWGMTPDQVIAASNGAASRQEAKPSKTGWSVFLLHSDYSTGPFKFEASFGFNMRSGTLREVELRLENGITEASRLQDHLIKKYGDPLSVELFGQVTRVTTWRDDKENNVIELLELPMMDSYILSYRALNYAFD
jgi:hypothetical protein